MLFDCRPKVLHKHCLQFLLGVKMAPRETENNAYAKFWGDKQRTLWYVMVFLEWSIGQWLLNCKNLGLDPFDLFWKHSKNQRVSCFYCPGGSGFTAYSKVSTLESRLKKLQICLPDSSDICGWKPNLQRKSWGLKNIWKRVDWA